MYWQILTITQRVKNGGNMKIAKKMAQVTLKMSKKGATGRMGLSWMTHCVDHFGVKEIIKGKYGDKKGSNREIEFFEKMMSGVMMRAAGGDRIEDIEVLRADKELVDSLGWNQIAGADTVLNFIRKKSNNLKMKKINEEMIKKVVRKSKIKEFTYDNDAMYIDSNKQSASYSYQKIKQYSGMMGCIVELGVINTMDYRTGNVSPAFGIINQLRKANRQVKEAGKRIKRFRCDSAGHQNLIFKYCDKENIEYYISMKKNEALIKVIDGIKEDQWADLSGRYEERTGTKYAQTMYRTQEGFHVRIMVLRWLNRDPDLFESKPYCYHVIATNNMEIQAMDWLEVHNGRMGSIEQSNRELKSELGAEYSPSHDFQKNRGYFILGVLAYNMIQVMKLYYLGESCLTMSVKRFRYKFIHVCGNIVKTGRKFYCNLMNVTNEVFELFRNCKSKLIITGY